MQGSIPAAALASLIATSAAMAGTPPHWSTDRTSQIPTADQRDSSQGNRRGDWKRSGTPSTQREVNGHGGGQRGSDRDANRETGDGRRSDADRDQHARGERRELTDPRPDFNSGHAQRDWDRNRRGDRDHRNWNDGNRDSHGDRHWDSDPNSRRGNRTHWRDDRGRDWHHERGWYSRYRVDHFRHSRGRFFARQRFFIGYYYVPFGYSSRVWGVGYSLPSAYYFNGRYVIDDYWRFDLYDPPFRCHWIRVGSNALLIDIDSGEVVDEIYDLFW